MVRRPRSAWVLELVRRAIYLILIYLLDRDVKAELRQAEEFIFTHAAVQFLDTGHFALETHPDEIADAMHQFLARTAT